MIRLSIAGIILISLLTACSASKEDEAKIRELQENAPLQEAFNVKFVFSEMANIQARLTAPHVVEIKEGEETVNKFDDGLHLEFFTKEGEKKTDLTANAGKFKNNFQTAEFRGNVILINETGEKLETETLYWDKIKNQVYTPEFVKIQTGDQIIYGDSMESNTDFTRYRIFKIRGSIQLDEDM